MALDWQPYMTGIVDRDFLMVMDKFECTIQYLPLRLAVEEKDNLRNFFIDALVPVVRDTPGCNLNDIYVPYLGQLAGDKGIPGKLIEGRDPTPMFVIHVRNPVFDFILKVGESAVQITKERSIPDSPT